jgi:hypothetical protein
VVLIFLVGNFFKKIIYNNNNVLLKRYFFAGGEDVFCVFFRYIRPILNFYPCECMSSVSAIFRIQPSRHLRSTSRQQLKLLLFVSLGNIRRYIIWGKCILQGCTLTLCRSVVAVLNPRELPSSQAFARKILNYNYPRLLALQKQFIPPPQRTISNDFAIATFDAVSCCYLESAQ